MRIDQRSVGGGLEALGEYMEPRARPSSSTRPEGCFIRSCWNSAPTIRTDRYPRTLHNDLALCGSRMIFSARTDPASKSVEHDDDEEAVDPEDDESVQHMPNYKSGVVRADHEVRISERLSAKANDHHRGGRRGRRSSRSISRNSRNIFGAGQVATTEATLPPVARLRFSYTAMTPTRARWHGVVRDRTSVCVCGSSA